MKRVRKTVIGLDVGTTTVKAVLVSDNGDVLSVSNIGQSVSVPRPGWTEQDPRIWWKSSVSAIQNILNKSHHFPEGIDISAIGLSGQMHSAVFLNEVGEVIRPAPLWNDMRTTSQCHQIIERLGMSGLHRTVGNLALEGFTAPKLLWLRDNEPGNFSRLRKLLLAKDYVRYRLTGELCTDPSDASGTILYDVRNREWSQEILEALNLPIDNLPDLVDSVDISGEVSRGIATELGITAGILVVGGGADNAAGAVGSGVVVRGRVQSSIGTSGTLLLPSDHPHIDEKMRLHTFCHCVTNQWYLMGTILSAGNSLRWLRDVIGGSNACLSYDQLTSEADQVKAGSDGLFFLPYLAGERTPHNNPDARGVFFGLHLGHTRGHLVRSVMEGVCFALRDSLELMRDTGIDFEEVRAIGGGAHSKLWRQIQADVFNVPVVTPNPSGGAAYGAALMAAVGAGIFGSIAEGVESWVRSGEVTEPNVTSADSYDELYDAYRKLYPALQERFENR